MSRTVSLELVDADSAREQALGGGPSGTRADLFKKAAVGGGALLTGGLLIGGLPKVAMAAPSARQDREILNFALLLEYLEAEFYTQAVANGTPTGELLDYATTLRDHENAHVAFLRDALGAAAIEKPEFDFGAAVTDEETFALTSIVLEDTGVAAYNGQAPRLRPQTLSAAASIVSVEARHAAWGRHIVFGPDYANRSQRPAPQAFDPLFSMRRVVRIVEATGFIQG